MFAAAASAQQAVGSLTVTAVVQGSAGLSVDSMSVHPASRTFTMDAPLDVICANAHSAIVTAHLDHAAPDGAVWTINGQRMDDATRSTIRVDASGRSTLTLLITVTAPTRGPIPAANRIVFDARPE